MSICIGDLNKAVKIQDRDYVAPVFGSADFDEDFTDRDIVWAKIKTVSGKTFFDDTGTETNITHIITIRYDENVNSEKWIELESGNKLDILAFENINEENEWLKLTCTDRGSSEASKA